MSDIVEEEGVGEEEVDRRRDLRVRSLIPPDADRVRAATLQQQQQQEDSEESTGSLKRKRSVKLDNLKIDDAAEWGHSRRGQA